ncbi:MAG: hypothetical protein HUU44_06020 [Ignavibacteriaceae bacterium]|jgi:hypothetical protein|nr:hypothetical protein [Ignavibacteriaceae bacterium]
MNKHNKQYFRIFYPLLFSFFIFNFSFLIATVRYVSKTGNSTPPYITWETAADSIQKCINICVFGDTIYVANGVYKEQVVMIDGLSLIGGGTDSCVVDSRDFPLTNNITLTMKNSCLVTGFYLRTSNDFNYGEGIWCEGLTGEITQNKFSNANTGIYLFNSNTKVHNNDFINLRRGIDISNSNSLIKKNRFFLLIDPNSLGIFISAFNSNYAPIIDSNEIVTASNGIIKAPGTRSTITNNEIKLISGSEGIFLHSFLSDSNWVYNNLIYTDLAGYAVYTNGSNYLQINNNYAKGNFLFYGLSIGPNHTVKNNVVTDSEGGVEVWGTQNLVYKFNDVWNNDENYAGYNPDTTNLSVDPMVVNDDTAQGELDFRLQMFSHLIDTGDPNILDKDGSRSDIGLYGGPYGESYFYIDLPPRTPVNLTANIDSNIVTLKWNKNTEADFSYYNLFYDTTKNFQIDSTKLVSSQPDTFYYFVIPPETDSLYFKLTAIDNQGNESNPSEEIGVVVTSVEDEWKPVNNYILYQNYPNPFNPSTKIGYKLKDRGYVKLYLYDIKGEQISVLVNEVQEAGYYEVEFNAQVGSKQEAVGKSLASGVYIYQIFVKDENNIPVFSDIKKMLLVK